MTVAVSTLSWWCNVPRSEWAEALREFMERLALTESQAARYTKPHTRKERGLTVIK